MGRPKKIKIETELAKKEELQIENVENEAQSTENEEISDQNNEITEIEQTHLPQKDLFRIDEVAGYFGVTERTIRLWIEHGHLEKEKVVGSIRISRKSILRCRFGSLAPRPEL